jgi:hypothetical protein
MNFKKFRDIGDSEPRAWNASIGTRFNADDDEDDNEIPVPYDEDEEVVTDDDEEEEGDELIEENETETETESVGSNPVKRYIRRGGAAVSVACIVLQEELDFREE